MPCCWSVLVRCEEERRSGVGDAQSECGDRVVGGTSLKLATPDEGTKGAGDCQHEARDPEGLHRDHSCHEREDHLPAEEKEGHGEAEGEQSEHLVFSLTVRGEDLQWRSFLLILYHSNYRRSSK